jgi:hypothetical protein
MPRRERRSKRSRRLEVTLPIDLALTIGASPFAEVDDEHLTAVFFEHAGDDPRAAEDKWPWGFWRYWPDVPDELRPEQDELTPVADEDPDADRDPPASERQDLDRRRAAWLKAQV